MKILITLTSSMQVGQEYIDLTHDVVTLLAQKGHGVVYGGTDYGMMHELADSYKNAGGGELVGVMAKDLMRVTKGYLAYPKLDMTYLEETMGGRKERMIELADAFLILPGGYGTIEELVTIVGAKVNKLHGKPIVILNYGGFYDTLVAFFTEMKHKDFSKINLSEVVCVVSDVKEALQYFETYTSKELADKFV
jgi:uncharacterized protein (TIGR00730 family)